ncbi:inositol monophosphatase family protein [Martelella mediterranea]|uniref:Fructose-1,6-bisphosphatase/inositol monophosphatase family enzyme n=1 Tax=Martelella mediterranea TaxID=293089 RepID=A0A4V2V3S3_9HYPH|nr:inositol monophosphatase family protein [Martelella mediterranea]TCT35185.1 fructose-1,6-bisphosphatase/inositol monophosphatase family enzyme [Martelella mediterranea]
MTVSSDTISAIAVLMRRAAKEEILPRFRHLQTGEVSSKSEPSDLVTVADTGAERVIKAGIAELLPEALFIGEEGVAADPDLLPKLKDADLAVVVDPIDGTFNFANGISAFGVMLAIVKNGETIAGLIYDPMGDDFMVAEKGSGSWLKRSDGSSQKMTVAEPVPLDQMIGAASVSFTSSEKRGQLLANTAKVRFAASYRCAAVEYRAFASGGLSFFTYMKLMPWDHLAGVLIGQEAGGYIARYDGSPYRPENLDGGLLGATDKESWRELREKVFTI